MQAYYPTPAFGLRAVGGSRHMFWTPPAPAWASPDGRPFRNHPALFGPLPVANLRPAWMGQAPAAENRLLGLPLNEILGRYYLLPDFAPWAVLTAPAYWNLPSPLGQWRPGDLDVLKAIAQAPSSEEMSDLSLINTFFAPQLGQGSVGMQRGTMAFYPDPGQSWAGGQKGICVDVLEEGGHKGFGRFDKQPAPDWVKDPFYCPPPADIPKLDEPILGAIVPHSYREYFGVDLPPVWGSVKRTVQNSAVFAKALIGYPFPTPINLGLRSWYEWNQADIQGLVHADLVLKEAYARYWITLKTLLQYDPMADGIVRKLKNKAKHEKIMDIVGVVAIAIVATLIGAVMAAALAPVFAGAASSVVSAVTSGVTNVIKIEDAKQAAKSMADAAKAFEATDAGFSEELDKAAKFLDDQAAAAEAKQAPTDAQRKFQEEQKSIAPAPSAAPLIVGGATIAAAAGVALLLLR